MPFHEITPRTFTPEGVRTYAPHAAGVYGITNASQWLYIASTGDIHRALLEVLEEPDSALMKKHPLGFVFELCDQSHSRSRVDRLMQEYQPVCNRKGSE